VRIRLSPTEGTEQSGTRSALVISATLFNEHSQLLIVAPLTSRKLDRIYPFEVLLDPLECDLDVPSKAMLNQIRAVDKARVVGVFGIASRAAMAAVDEALRLTIGLTQI
jgi:mRNA interferase MazF